jgi:hypothetical protein
MGAICNLLAVVAVPLAIAEQMDLPTRPIRESLIGLCQAERRHSGPKGDIFEGRRSLKAPSIDHPPKDSNKASLLKRLDNLLQR